MPQRRFFQSHLSTAVVLMVVAGVLVWANVRERYSIISPFGDSMLKAHGWPFECHYRRFDSLTSMNTGQAATKQIEPIQTIFNALIALAILLSVRVACEWRIRRRAVPPQKSP